MSIVTDLPGFKFGLAVKAAAQKIDKVLDEIDPKPPVKPAVSLPSQTADPPQDFVVEDEKTTANKQFQIFYRCNTSKCPNIYNSKRLAWVHCKEQHKDIWEGPAPAYVHKPSELGSHRL